MEAGKRLGMVKNSACGAGVVDYATLAPRTQWRVVSADGEIGKQAMVLGRGVACRQHGRGGASHDYAGMESWFENGWETMVIREEGESDEFFIFISVRMTVLPVGPFGHQGPPMHVRMKWTPYSQHYTIMSEGCVLLLSFSVMGT
jgi:hypothetical protein